MFQEELADRPALLLAALLVVLGMQIFALGLLGELIIFTHARDLKDYRVEDVIHYEDAVYRCLKIEPARRRAWTTRTAEIERDELQRLTRWRKALHRRYGE